MSEQPARPIERSETILIVDDQPSIRQLVRATLKQLGFTKVLEAEDGAEALALLTTTRADLVLLDGNMPRMDGLTTLRAIRGSARFSGLPVVMLTGRADSDFVKSAVALGISGFLLKPFTAAGMGERIRSALAVVQSELADRKVVLQP